MDRTDTELSTQMTVDLVEKQLIQLLYVDDESGMLQVAKQCMEAEGLFLVDTAASVKKAKEMINDQRRTETL